MDWKKYLYIYIYSGLNIINYATKGGSIISIDIGKVDITIELLNINLKGENTAKILISAIVLDLVHKVQLLQVHIKL